MNVKFTHYLITRFNIPVNNWNKDKAGNPVLDDQWMQNRLELFAGYCVPTIANQSERNFIWRIYCDQQTRPPFLDEIRKLTAALPMVQLVLVSDFDHLLNDLRELLAQVTTPFIITSRLDNDDGLGPHFISDVQKHFVEEDKRIINFTKGVLYDHHRGVLNEIRDSRRNHYGSLIEKVNNEGELITVVGYPHGIPPKDSSIDNVDTRFAWLKIIHERNMVSKTNGIPLLQENIRAHFNLKEKAFKVSWWNTCWFVVRRLLSKIKRLIIPS